MPDPFYTAARFFRPLTPERIEEIRAIRTDYRVGEPGWVSRHVADRAYDALQDLLDEVARLGGG